MQYLFEMTRFVLHNTKYPSISSHQFSSCLPSCSSSPPSSVILEKSSSEQKTHFFLAEDKQFLSFGHFGWTKPGNVEEYFILWNVCSTESSVGVFVVCGSYLGTFPNNFSWKTSVQLQFFNLNLCGSCYTQKAKLWIGDMRDIILKFSCFLFPPHVASL